MNRSIPMLTSAVVCCVCTVAAAANKADKGERVVDAVLAQEARAAVPNRANDLGGAVHQSDRAHWAAGYIRTTDGWQMFDTVTVDDRVREYEQRRGTDRLRREQHLALADWCRSQKLIDQNRAHLWAVLTGDPGASYFWEQLGYENVNGIWMTKGEQRRMENQQRELENAYQKWRPRAQSLAVRLSSDNPGTHSAARTELNTIDDVQATLALESSLSESSPAAALNLVEWLTPRVKTGTTLALVRLSVASPWKEVRTMATDAVRRRRLDQTMPPLLCALSTPTNLTVDQSYRPSRTGDAVVSAVLERETWNTIERRNYLIKLGPQLHLSIGERTGIVKPFVRNWTPTWLEQNDLDRLRSDFNRKLEQGRKGINAGIVERNQRVSSVLSQITGETSDLTPEDWWASWSKYSETEAPSTKEVVEVSETDTILAPRTTISFHPSCLPAGIFVATSSGQKRVEAIQIGDTVLAKDIETGELAYKPVIRTTIRAPQPLTALHTKDETIRATHGHYFWVSGQGWRMSKEIKVGDRLHGVQGTVTVTDITHGGREAVYNLVVEGASSYFVGESRILSHDVTPPVPTDIVVPGLAAR